MSESEFLPESLQQFRENASTECELWNLAEILVTDLDECRKENKNLRDQLNDVLSKNDSVSQIYLDVEEENTKLKDENKTLKFKLNSQKLKFESEISEIEKSCENKLITSAEEYKKLEQKLNKKEREFFEELQMAQATAAYEFEKIEKQLKWQISEANKQLYEMNLINSKLRKQVENMNIENMREDKSKNKTTPARSKEIPAISTEINKNYETSKKVVDITTNNSPLRTYEPLQVERYSMVDGIETPPLFKGKSRFSKNLSNSRANNRINISGLPPLIPCSDAAPKTQKRRRLHDPDDLSYLIDLIPPEE